MNQLPHVFLLTVFLKMIDLNISNAGEMKQKKGHSKKRTQEISSDQH